MICAFFKKVSFLKIRLCIYNFSFFFCEEKNSSIFLTQYCHPDDAAQAAVVLSPRLRGSIPQAQACCMCKCPLRELLLLFGQRIHPILYNILGRYSILQLCPLRRVMNFRAPSLQAYMHVATWVIPNTLQRYI